MTRAMLAAVLYRMDINAQAPALKTSFADVSADSYYANAVSWAVANKITNGTSDKTYSPDTAITREQLVTLLKNFADYLGRDTSARTSLSGFADHAEASDYAVNALEWAVQSKFIKGRPDGTLDPKGTATRAEVAAVLVNFNTIK